MAPLQQTITTHIIVALMMLKFIFEYASTEFFFVKRCINELHHIHYIVFFILFIIILYIGIRLALYSTETLNKSCKEEP